MLFNFQGGVIKVHGPTRLWTSDRRRPDAISPSHLGVFMKMRNLHSRKVSLGELGVPRWYLPVRSVRTGAGATDAYARANQKHRLRLRRGCVAVIR